MSFADRRNETEQDARNRVYDARVGSLADASDRYLVSLERAVQEWAADVAAELDYRNRR